VGSGGATCEGKAKTGYKEVEDYGGVKMGMMRRKFWAGRVFPDEKGAGGFTVGGELGNGGKSMLE